MSNHTRKLTDKEVLTHARDGLKEHLHLQAGGYHVATDDLYHLILNAAVRTSTLQMVCQHHNVLFTPQAARHHINTQVRKDNLDQLEQEVNQALRAQIPQPVFKRAQKVAIDFHDRPYYGRTSQADGLWVTGQGKAGTHRFYRVATAYVVCKGLRVTLAICFVRPKQSNLEVLRFLLRRIHRIRICIRLLFLDKGFDGIQELTYLQRRKTRAVIACTIRGKTGGTKALCTGNKSYTTEYTFQGRGKKKFTAKLAVCRVFTTAKRRGIMKRRAEWLIYILIHNDLKPLQAKEQYKYRFGIETSYRCSGQVRGWTTSNNPAYRFLLIGLAFYLQNVWIHFQHRIAVQLGSMKDKQRYVEDVFRLSRLANFIRQALEEIYAPIREISLEPPPGG